jgi:osmotically-inducible protein OsmY
MKNPPLAEQRSPTGQTERLPEDRRDDEINADVVNLLWYRSAVDQADLRYVKVRTHDGVVVLRGKTGTERSRRAIEALVEDVRGVRGVRNRLRTFEALSAAS